MCFQTSGSKFEQFDGGRSKLHTGRVIGASVVGAEGLIVAKGWAGDGVLDGVLDGVSDGLANEARR